MTISNKNIALSVIAGFILMDLVGNSLIADVMTSPSKNLDLSAFKNFSNNLVYLSQNKVNNEEPERLKIEEFAISGIARRLDADIASNQIRKTIKRELEKKQIVATKETEFKLTDEVKFAFSGLEKTSKKIEVEHINERAEAPIPSFNNDIKEPSFNSVKITNINVDLLENLKETYEEKTEVAISLKESEKETNDDLVVFDYSSKKAEEFDKKLYDRPLSNAVRSVIEREINNNPVKIAPIAKAGEEKQNQKNNMIETIVSRIDAKSEDVVPEKNIKEEEQPEIVYEYSAPKSEKMVSNFRGNEPSKQIQINLKTIEVDNQIKKIKNGYGFEFEPDYDRNERLYDNNTGIINIGFNSTETANETSGIVYKQGFVPTRIDLANENMDVKIPLMGEEGFEQRFQIDNNNRNSIIIARNEGVEDIEIDSEYSNKLLLDSAFNIVKSNPSFVMFTSVKTGNILIKYNHFGTTVQKIVYIGEGELYFQNPQFVEGERESFELTTKNLLAQTEKSLDVSNRDLKVFNTNTFSKKQALNVYELMMPKKILGSRNYLELKNQGNDIFIGTDKSDKIQIPNKEYVGKILESFKTSDLNDRCLIQFNFKTTINNFKIGGKNKSGEMYTEVLALDQDGNLVADDYSNIDKIFVLGENEGQVSIQAESENGLITNAKSFCSNGTYLIEQM